MKCIINSIFDRPAFVKVLVNDQYLDKISALFKVRHTQKQVFELEFEIWNMIASSLSYISYIGL